MIKLSALLLVPVCVQALTLTAVRKDDKADLSLRSVYNYGNYGFTAIFNTSDKVNVTATIDKVGAARQHGSGMADLCETAAASGD